MSSYGSLNRDSRLLERKRLLLDREIPVAEAEHLDVLSQDKSSPARYLIMRATLAQASDRMRTTRQARHPFGGHPSRTVLACRMTALELPESVTSYSRTAPAGHTTVTGRPSARARSTTSAVPP